MYLPYIILETPDELHSHIPKLIFSPFQVHYDLHLKAQIKILQRLYVSVKHEYAIIIRKLKQPCPHLSETSLQLSNVQNNHVDQCYNCSKQREAIQKGHNHTKNLKLAIHYSFIIKFLIETSQMSYSCNFLSQKVDKEIDLIE